jgi:excisionase family DNA binding protein
MRLVRDGAGVETRPQADGGGRESVVLTPLLTAAELAAYCHVGLSTVYSWASTGVVPAIRIGGTVRFDPAAVEAALKGGSS